MALTSGGTVIVRWAQLPLIDAAEDVMGLLEREPQAGHAQKLGAPKASAIIAALPSYRGETEPCRATAKRQDGRCPLHEYLLSYTMTANVQRF